MLRAMWMALLVSVGRGRRVLPTRARTMRCSRYKVTFGRHRFRYRGTDLDIEVLLEVEVLLEAPI